MTALFISDLHLSPQREDVIGALESCVGVNTQNRDAR